MINHVVCVVVDHPAVVYLAGDLAANMRRRRLLCAHAALAVVLVEIVFIIIVLIGEGGGRRGRPVGVAEVAGAPVWVKFPLGEGVPIGGRDGEVGVSPQA
jgi:hypothetical protein